MVPPPGIGVFNTLCLVLARPAGGAWLGPAHQRMSLGKAHRQAQGLVFAHKHYTDMACRRTSAARALQLTTYFIDLVVVLAAVNENQACLHLQLDWLKLL